MIEITILALVGYAGWKQMPWWTPLAGAIVSLAITAFKMTRVSGMRSEAGLPPFETTEYVGSMLTIFVLTMCVYVFFRWLSARRAKNI